MSAMWDAIARRLGWRKTVTVKDMFTGARMAAGDVPNGDPVDTTPLTRADLPIIHGIIDRAIAAMVIQERQRMSLHAADVEMLTRLLKDVSKAYIDSLGLKEEVDVAVAKRIGWTLDAAADEALRESIRKAMQHKFSVWVTVSPQETAHGPESNRPTVGRPADMAQAQGDHAGSLNPSAGGANQAGDSPQSERRTTEDDPGMGPKGGGL